MGIMRKSVELGKMLAKSLVLPYLYYPVASIFSNEHVHISEIEARKAVMDFSSKPSGVCSTQNHVKNSYTFDLQIIVPAYNVEAYLQTCIESVLNQKTKYSFQIVLIDDGSTDKTSAIAEAFCDDRLKVIHQQNRGFSGARNTGLKIIDAKYIAFVDSDDWLPDGAIEALMDVAVKQNADVVQGGFYTQTSDQVSVAKAYSCTVRTTDVTDLYGQPWGKVFRSSLWERLCFPEGYWFEDTILSFLIYPQIEDAWLVNRAVYVYRNNATGITQTSSYKPKCVDTYWITEKVMEEYTLLGLALDHRCLKRFCRQIVVNSHRMRNMPKEIRQAVFALTCELYEKYFSEFGIDSQYADLQKAIKRRNYGLYDLFTKVKRWQ